MPLLAVIACAAFAFVQATNCSNCKSDPRRPLLCAAHLEDETAVLKEQRAIYKQALDPEERIAALEHVAALTSEHINAPSVNVARFLAEGLRDESLDVRRRALALIIDGQHHEEAVRAVIDAWKESQRGWRVLDAKLVLSETPAEPGKPAVALTTEELTGVPEYIEALLHALGHLRDERALTILQSFLRSPLDRTPGRFIVAASSATLALDSRRACELVIELLGALEEAFVEGAVPRRFAAAGRTDLLAALKAPLENADARDHADISAMLDAYARSRQLQPPDGAESLLAADWRSWFKLARNSLPERIASE